MKTLHFTHKAILLISGLLLLAASAQVLAKDDHRRARELSATGEIMPLEQLLQKLHGYGRVLEVELESEHGQHVYEIEFLDSQGRVQKRYFDARSGEALSGKPGDD